MGECHKRRAAAALAEAEAVAGREQLESFKRAHAPVGEGAAAGAPGGAGGEGGVAGAGVQLGSLLASIDAQAQPTLTLTLTLALTLTVTLTLTCVVDGQAAQRAPSASQYVRASRHHSQSGPACPGAQEASPTAAPPAHELLAPAAAHAYRCEVSGLSRQ